MSRALIAPPLTVAIFPLKRESDTDNPALISQKKIAPPELMVDHEMKMEEKV